MRLFDHLEQFGDSPALIEEGAGTLSYLDLAARADEIGAVPPERSIAFCLCSNTTESVVGYVGLQRAGHVCLMLNAAIDVAKLRDLMKQFPPAYMWVPSSAGLSIHGGAVASSGSYELIDTGSDRVEVHPDLALLMATSGSTGSPMMVRQSSRNLSSNAQSIAASLSLTKEDRALTTLPMNYTYGLSIINSQLATGGSIVMSEATVMDRMFWERVSGMGVTYFGGVPYTYEMLARLGLKRLEGSSLRMMTRAGGKLAPELVGKMVEEANKIGVEFIVMYGQTEATARMSVLPASEVMNRPDSIGRPIPGGSFRVVDTVDGREVGTGEVGELEYTGPNVTMGYAQNASELNRDDDFGGTLLTGDLARQDAEGFFYVVGRRKRFVKLFGNRVSLDHVEAHLRENGYESACTGVDDCLCVNVVRGKDTSHLTELVAGFVGVHKKAIKIVEIERIPRSESGKILYSELDVTRP